MAACDPIRKLRTMVLWAMLGRMKPFAGKEFTFDDAVRLAVANPTARLIAIDGLPVSGKSTLAERIARAANAKCLYLDDFVKPEGEWQSRSQPSFPFDYIRYDEFLDAVKSLARNGECTFRPYDWERGRVQEEPRTIQLVNPVIIEGVSALHPSCRHYTICGSGSIATLQPRFQRRFSEVLALGNGSGVNCSCRVSTYICKLNPGNVQRFMRQGGVPAERRVSAHPGRPG